MLQQNSTPSDVYVVILAAGRGERFHIAGISVPKPLIEFGGRTLLKRTLDTALGMSGPGQPTKSIIVVGTDVVAAEAHRTKGVDRAVAVSVTQPGPVASAMLALAHIPLAAPVVFMDCDNAYSRDFANLPFWHNFLVVSKVSQNLVATDFCNVVPGDDSLMCSSEEKVDLGTGLVATGIYGFASAMKFRHAVLNVLAHHVNLKLDKEVPMSAITNFCSPGVKLVYTDAWDPIGTPEQLIAAGRRMLL
jgi:NDP-sugar pyrophosphorylase family protein